MSRSDNTARKRQTGPEVSRSGNSVPGSPQFLDQLLEKVDPHQTVAHKRALQLNVFCARLLALLRVTRGLTTAQLAERIRVSPDTLKLLESGVLRADQIGEPALDRLSQTLAAGGWTAAWILGVARAASGRTIKNDEDLLTEVNAGLGVLSCAAATADLRPSPAMFEVLELLYEADRSLDDIHERAGSSQGMVKIADALDELKQQKLVLMSLKRNPTDPQGRPQPHYSITEPGRMALLWRWLREAPQAKEEEPEQQTGLQRGRIPRTA